MNVVANDIDNDFSHPHTTVIQGWQIDNVAIKNIENTPIIKRISDDSLITLLSEKIKNEYSSLRGSFDPRKYLATSIMLWYPRFFISNIRPIETKPIDCTSIRVYGVASCFAEDRNSGYPINSSIAINNRKAIKKWIQHSKDNGYKLIFADVNTQFFNVYGERSIQQFKQRQFFCSFIKKQGSSCFSFVNYLDGRGIKNWNDVRWKRDGHFNMKGNQLYADFLSKIFREIS